MKSEKSKLFYFLKSRWAPEEHRARDVCGSITAKDKICKRLRVIHKKRRKKKEEKKTVAMMYTDMGVMTV